MKIFEWIEEIEKIYKDLINKAKNENLNELENLRSQQENNMEEKIEINKNIVESALKSQLKVLKEKDMFILEKIKDFKIKMEKEYQKSKEYLFELLIKDIGFDF
ncbi:MAG: hypothetical protein ACFE8B_12670 [Candidatus Hermodarchaeota archaeon]